MDSDNNPDIGSSGHYGQDQTAEEAAERRSAEDEDLRESLMGLTRLASDRLRCASHSRRRRRRFDAN